jgi:thiamine pyrophosphate-dependent acetolactate synthase large subunit-like protein
VRATGGVVATLPKAKGIVSESDESFVGTLEMVGDDLVVALLRQADVVVAVGVDVVEFDKPWRLDTPVIQVDRVPTETVYLRSEIEMSGPLDALLDALAPDRPASGWPREGDCSPSRQPRGVRAHDRSTPPVLAGRARGSVPRLRPKRSSRATSERTRWLSVKPGRRTSRERSSWRTACHRWAIRCLLPPRPGW